MKKWTFTLFLSFCSTLLFAQSALEVAPPKKKGRKQSVSQEAEVSASYVGGVKMRIGNVNIGDVAEQNTYLKVVQSREMTEGRLLRVGAAAERFSFGLPDAAPLPNTLQSTHAVLGMDFDLGDSWLFRAEIYPGVYSDFSDIGGDDFNAPMVFGGTYLSSEKFQWFFGISVNARRDMPVLPGVGFRWQFADQWTLMALFPKPRLEYKFNDNLTFYAGGELKGDTYAVSKNFGSSHGRPVLNNAMLDYSEGRIGAGASWKVTPSVTVDIDGGAMVYRSFDFHEHKQSFHEDGIAPYGQVAIKAGF